MKFLAEVRAGRVSHGVGLHSDMGSPRCVGPFRSCQRPSGRDDIPLCSSKPESIFFLSLDKYSTILKRGGKLPTGRAFRLKLQERPLLMLARPVNPIETLHPAMGAPAILQGRHERSWPESEECL